MNFSDIYLGPDSEFEYVEASTRSLHTSPDRDSNALIYSTAHSISTFASRAEYEWVTANIAVEASPGALNGPTSAPNDARVRFTSDTILGGDGAEVEWVLLDPINIVDIPHIILGQPKKEERPAAHTITSSLSGTTYTIQALIGRGAFGEVVQASTNRGESVAIKINKKSAPNTENVSPLLSIANPETVIDDQREFILNEREVFMRIATAGTGPGSARYLVGLRECFQDAGNVYFVMPLYASNVGEHCRLRLPPPQGTDSNLDSERPSLSRGQIRIWAAELLLGLEALHGLGVVHRDLKPENVLVTSSGHLAVADFGLSAVFPSPSSPFSHDGQSPTSHLNETPFSTRQLYDQCGTPGYFAPEVSDPQVEEQGYDAQIDIYGFGLILLEMATGERCIGAYAGDSPSVLFAAGREFQRTVSAYLDRQFGTAEEIKEDEDEGARDLKALLRIVLSRVPEKRGSWAALKGHAFFRGVDWEEVAMEERNARNGTGMPIVERVGGTTYVPRAMDFGGDGEYPVEFCAESWKLDCIMD